ncbi:hypothetical protein FA95DRAFT_698784 [Auriscalpium vulgare]|uniref:Uncharacterized protein n=1 Tax=Auriscalpium vulgare TaxID=40419 RepID=A0ACB8S2B4_9AGAM|nr:hypothetical protein FA95DRAFT_698784 [Auriscalpium vulgare]
MIPRMGGLYIGILVAAALWGVTALQTWFYYREYTKDPWYLKLLVGVVFLLDTVHQVFISHTGYMYFVTHYFDPQYLAIVPWSILAEVMVAGFVALLVQIFFVHRIYILSEKNAYLTAGVAALVCAQFGVTSAYCGKAFSMSTYAEIGTIKGLSMGINGTTAASDLVIALVLCGLLHTSRTGFKNSDTLINKLIIFTMNTGLLTSIDAIFSLATIAALPDKFIYIGFFFALSRLYSNSLLATLNARAHFRNDSSHGNSSFALSISDRPGVRPLHSQPNNITIRIDTTKEFNHDRDGDDTGSDRKL